jgi:hypothetical protein
MQSPNTEPEPYLTATLTSTDSILDLSGKKPFTFLITLTLHNASAPILAYTSPSSTFFLPRSALTDVGLIFTDHKINEEVKICHIDSAKSPGYARRLTDKTRLLLLPGKPEVFKIPIDVLSNKDTETGFDPWMATLSSAFSSGNFYSATLPLYRTLDWWRYAKSSEFQRYHESSASSLSNASDDASTGTVESVVDETSDVEARYGVPVLAYDQHLPIYIEGDGVVFSCTGKAMEWPTSLLEKQKTNKQKRDGQERKKTEELRGARENAD